MFSKIKKFFLVHSVQVSIWYVKYGREESMDICMLCIKQDERNKGLGGLLVSQVNLLFITTDDNFPLYYIGIL